MIEIAEYRQRTVQRTQVAFIMYVTVRTIYLKLQIHLYLIRSKLWVITHSLHTCSYMLEIVIWYNCHTCFFKPVQDRRQVGWHTSRKNQKGIQTYNHEKSTETCRHIDGRAEIEAKKQQILKHRWTDGRIGRRVDKWSLTCIQQNHAHKHS